MNDGNMTKFSVSDLEKRTRTKSQTDMARLRDMTEAELEGKIATDPDWSDVPADWYLKAEAAMQRPKKLFSLRMDADVLDWFKSQGSGYQTRMNAVLRTFMEHAARG
jgi:uncharacterized protein (DUF4415 family)